MKKLLVLTGHLFFLSVVLHAQNIDSTLQVMAAKHPAEKLYLHCDKDQYLAGETVWFKAYLYSDGRPSSMSSNLYVQLLDASGRSVGNWHYPVMGAVAKGNIPLPDTLSQGNYFLRALTVYQLNGEEDFVYKKNIYVFNPLRNPAPVAAAPSALSLQFFPESGDLLNGILTVVAFKATDQYGRPQEVNGMIRTAEGNTVAPFHTTHDGMGRLQFKPLAGKKYVAEVETAGGKRSFNLPAVKEEGVNLKLTDEPGGKKFQLSRATKSGQFASVWLVAQINQHLVYETEIAFEDYPSVIGHIITDSLPSGILHFTVFSEGLPVAERLAFVDNGEYRGAGTIQAVNLNTARRGENTVSVVFPDSIQHSCSVSITDLSAGELPDGEHIYSRLLLTGDLKGHVYNPDWYFDNPADSVKQPLDNLMLTQGWSRFEWKKLLAGQFPVIRYRDQPLLAIGGQATDEKTGRPIAEGTLNLYLEAADSSTRNLEFQPGAEGRFYRDSLLYEGEAKVYYSWLDRNGKIKPVNVTLDADSIGALVFAARPAEQVNGGFAGAPSAVTRQEIEKRFAYVQDIGKEAKELAAVTVRTQANKKPLDIVNEKYTTGVFRAEGKENLDNINNPVGDKGLNAVDYIKNRIQQLEIQRGGFVNRKNFSLQSGQNWAVGIFINEIPADLNQLRTWRADDLALVKFYEAGFVGVGSQFPGGALAVYTKERSNKDLKPDLLKYVTREGYSVTREFYQPDYAANPSRPAAEDRRTTLYWNPDVYTGNESKSINLKFFNNDVAKKFRVVLEGFDARGRLVHVEKVIE